MTLQEFYAMLQETRYPVAYREFKDPPEYPCIVYFETERENKLADDTVYAEFKGVRIELYTSTKSTEAEKALEEVLLRHEIIYDFSEVGKIESEDIYQVVYDVQI